MSQIRGQLWQQFLHVSALLVPGNESMNAKAVPQIMKPRLVACAIRAADTGMLTEVFESLLHELNRYGPAPTQHKERRAASLRVASFGSTRGAKIQIPP